MQLSGIRALTGATIVFVTHSIRAAVCLADRIIILTRGPSTVFENYNVPITRPRTFEDPMIGEVEADIVRRVEGAWGLEPVKPREVA